MFCKRPSGAAGRGSGKRPISTAIQLHRPGDSGGARPPVGTSGPVRVRPGVPSISATVPGRDETFRLEMGEVDFGAIIRLTPDIVMEIKRLEAQGGAAKIKFDENANNSAGNVVEVGGKEFRFTWSREPTDLCNIYEERQNGDDGDGLLVECGAAWRKLNVQRILDESTKNHVKMRSEEAERMLKSRKAIVLDPTNPSVKNQAKSMAAAAVEGNMRRMGWKKNKEMLSKKRKVENYQGAAAPSQSKSASKSATASNSNFKGILSPVPSPQLPQPRTLHSASMTGKMPRGDSNSGANTPLLNINKEEIGIIAKKMPTGVSGDSMQEIHGYEEGNIDHPINLQSMLINLLSQNPKGLSIKAIEGAVGEVFPNSLKKMEDVLKNVATLQAPGRYFLKKGRQVESSTKSSEGGSSPECSNKQTKRTFSSFEKAIVERLDQETRISKNEEESDPIERVDITQGTEDPLSMDEKVTENSVVRAGSSSGSGSDSDSDSGSSESDSGSRSKAGSGSASSSDSESDGSSSSKEASDVDVDIMTSDDERVAVQSIDATASRSSLWPRLSRSNGEHDIVITESDQKENGTTLDLPDLENLYGRVNSVANTEDFSIGEIAKTFEKQEAKTAENIISYLQQSKSRSSAVYPDDNKVTKNQHQSPFRSFNDEKHRLTRKRSFKEEQTLMKTGSEQLDNHESITEMNSKKPSNTEHLHVKSRNSKRMKNSSSAEASFVKGKGARSSESPRTLSPQIFMQMDQKIIMSNYQRDERREIDLLDKNLPEHALSVVNGNNGQMQSSTDSKSPPNFATEQSGRKVVESSWKKRTFDTVKPFQYVESNGRSNKRLQTVHLSPDPDISGLKNMQVDKILAVNGKQDENDDIQDTYHAKSAKEIIIGEKISSTPDIVNIKSTCGYVNVKGNVLMRELSDLELGEFREPVTDVMGEDKRPLETSSFKKIENKVTLPDSKVDINMNKCDGIGVSKLKKQSPPISRKGLNGKVSADDSLGLSHSQSSFMQPQSRKSSRMDVTEPESMVHLGRCAESGGKNGTRTEQVMGSQNDGSCPKTTSTRTLKDDNRRGVLVGCKNVKGSKSDILNGLMGLAEQGTEGLTTNNATNYMKSMEFSSDEENAPYLKYSKAELDLRGPIKDLSMYKDYVRVFQEKYSYYCSLNKKLEKIRNLFINVGDELELARGRDMEEYYDIVEKLRQMYQQHGERHKEMKRIFILLYDELKDLKQRIKDFAAVHSGE